MWECTARHCRLGLFQDSDSAGDLDDSKSPRGGGGVHVSSEVERSFLYVGCAINNLQFHTAPLNLRLSHWISVSARMVFPLLISGIWLSKSHTLLQSIQEHGSASCVINTVKNIPTKERINSLTHREILVGQLLIASHQRQTFLASMPCFIFKDNEAAIKMIIKGRSSTMRHVSRTHRVALGRLFDRINLDLPKSKSNMSIPKVNSPTFEPRAVSLVMSGTIFSFCSTLFEQSNGFLQPCEQSN